MVKRNLIVCGALSMAMAFSVGALAQEKEFPTKPLRIFVPFTAGSGSDTTARFFGDRLAKQLGQTAVIENKPGASGIISVQALLALPADMQARFLRIAEMLEDLGPQRVGLPHIRPLESKLWEMRMKGRDGIARAVYVAVSGRRLVVLHVFIKKTQTTPRSAIETALKRMEKIE